MKAGRLPATPRRVADQCAPVHEASVSLLSNLITAQIYYHCTAAQGLVHSVCLVIIHIYMHKSITRTQEKAFIVIIFVEMNGKSERERASYFDASIE